MSRIGRKPVVIPKGVEVKMDGRHITVKGPKGTLTWEIPEGIKCEEKDGTLVFSVSDPNKKKIKAFWGLARAYVNNMVVGVSQGFKKELEIVGKGYKVVQEGKDLVFEIGYSHPVRVSPPESITLSAKGTRVTVEGIDKALVGQVAADIRSIRPPDPYKGKGIRYVGEVVRVKERKGVR